MNFENDMVEKKQIMASNTEIKNMTKKVVPPPAYEEEEKVDYKALYEKERQVNDSLNNVYRQTEDENAKLKAEIAKLKAEAEPKADKPITLKDVRAWCREKYGKDWHKEQKAERKVEAKKALKAEREKE
jgi:hypothetical protein